MKPTHKATEAPVSARSVPVTLRPASEKTDDMAVGSLMGIIIGSVAIACALVVLSLYVVSQRKNPSGANADSDPEEAVPEEEEQHEAGL
jgi:hypothetical protein